MNIKKIKSSERELRIKESFNGKTLLTRANLSKVIYRRNKSLDILLDMRKHF